ncbi:acyltransferase ChoActase/COT/CPT [Russula emetica]|nr:acyltransferase ChoActase/COT/CPT [Russula emetica]
MLRYQASLPHLPVPPLASTISKYLETLRPHLSPAEYARSESKLRAFGASKQAEELQRRLEARASDSDSVEGVVNVNWLADWWDETAYMAFREPVVVNVSYFYVHANLCDSLAPKRTARLLKAMLPFRTLVETAQLEPEKVRGAPLCMDSYKWLFHASRYPAIPKDTAHKFDPATHNHVVFIRNNRFFEVQLAYPDGTELSAADLEALRIVVPDTLVPSPMSSCRADTHKGVPFGALTSENRDTWTHLDNSEPTSREDLSWGAWVGDGRNRWYDKHQLIVWDNGPLWILGEHSCMDGTPTLRMNEFMLGSLAAKKIDFGSPLPTANDAVLADVQEAVRNFDKLVAAHDLRVLHYDVYGKNFIKQFKISPDAWAQLVKQLAFYKFKGRPAVTYESAQTRKFQRGRTEVIRAASSQSKAWVDTMVDPGATDARRAALFHRAATRHVQYAAHLFGLKKMIKDGEALPELYQDPAFSHSNHWELSTSQLSSRYLDGWGYGEVVPDGYGLSYSIGDDYIRWTITSLKLGTDEFKRCLAEAATETMQMMERARRMEGTKTKL